jgi:hypothetical protein
MMSRVARRGPLGMLLAGHGRRQGASQEHLDQERDIMLSDESGCAHAVQCLARALARLPQMNTGGGPLATRGKEDDGHLLLKTRRLAPRLGKHPCHRQRGRQMTQRETQ